MRRWLLLALLGLLGLGVVISRRSCGARHERWRFATWNIEDFPKDGRQIEGVFAELAELDASFVAVQEISDPARFAREAQQRLGPAWQFAHADTAPPRMAHHNGVLFDAGRWSLRSIVSYDDTRIGDHKPIVEVRLAPVDGGEIVRILVVHLKSGAEHELVRARQLEGLAAILRRVRGSGERLVVLGDFNATGDPDRRRIAALAEPNGLRWATEGLACSAFWRRADDCPRSRLDHVLMWRPPAAVAARGECERAGCEDTDRCPRYAREISDHCPVVVDVD